MNSIKIMMTCFLISFDAISIISQDLLTQIVVSPFNKNKLNEIEVHYYNLLQKNPVFLKDPFFINQDSIKHSSYLFRITGEDKEENLNFYGLSIAALYHNKVASLSGLILSINLGDFYNNILINVNGINISILNTATFGNINGISIAGLSQMAKEYNGFTISLSSGDFTYLNGISIGGFTSRSKNANGIQISFINVLCQLNGIGIGSINMQGEPFCQEDLMANGLVLGVMNALNIRGLSLGIINKGNSWIQIGLLNWGDSIVQIGLVNLDENNKMRIPFININF